MNLNIENAGNIENLFEDINSSFSNLFNNTENLKQGQKLAQYGDLYKDNVMKNINLLKPLNISNHFELMTIREAMEGSNSTTSSTTVSMNKITETEKEFNSTLLEYSNTYKIFMDDLIKRKKIDDNSKKYLDNTVTLNDEDYVYVNKFGFTHKYSKDAWNGNDSSCPKTSIKISSVDYNKLQPGPDMGLGQACKIAGQNVQNEKNNEIAWVDIKGYKHVYTNSIWENKLDSCSKYNPIKLSEKAYNNIPTGSSMTESTMCSQLDMDPVIWDKLSKLNDKLITLATTIVKEMDSIHTQDSGIKSKLNEKQNLLNSYIKQLNDDKSMNLNKKVYNVTEGKYSDSNTFLKYNQSQYIVWLFLLIFLIIMIIRTMNGDESGNNMTPLFILVLLIGLYVFLK